MTQEMRVDINVVSQMSGSTCMSGEGGGIESKTLGGWEMARGGDRTNT